MNDKNNLTGTSGLTYMKVKDIKIPFYRQRKDLGNIESLAESIKELGLIQPIVVRDEGTLVVGERRLTAIKSLGWETVPVLNFGELNELAQLEIELDENCMREPLTYQEKIKAVAKIYKIRSERGESMRDVSAGLGMNIGSVSTAIQLHEAIQQHPEIGKQPNAHKARKALQKIEERSILLEMLKRKKAQEHTEPDGNEFKLMDCRDYLKTLPDESVDLIATDPQFGVDIEDVSRHATGTYTKVYKEKDSINNYWDLMSEVIPQLFRVLKEDSHLYMFFGIQHYQKLIELLQSTGFNVSEIPMLWVKEGTTGQTNRPERWPGRCYEPIFFAHKGMRPLIKQGQPDVILVPILSAQRKRHPFEKPINLWSEIIERSCLKNSGDVVLDPFAGTASSLIAAKQHGLTYKGCELLPEWHAYGSEVLGFIKTVPE